MICFSCKSPLDSVISDQNTVSRSSSCPKCLADIRICKNCLFFDTNYHNECREPQAEIISEKEKANFCDYFRIIPQGRAKESQKPNSKKGRENFENLFKPKE